MGYIVAIFITVSGAILTLCFVPSLKKYAKSWGFIDKPSGRRIHSSPIPRCGGIAVFLATHLTIVGYILFGNNYEEGQFYLWLELIFGSSIIIITGLLDDKYSLPAWVKLGVQLVVASLMFFFGYSFGEMLEYPLPLFLDITLTVFWFVLLMNAFNLIDGMDGICTGLGLIASLTVGIICLYIGNIFSAAVLLALAGSCLGFLRYNFNPATIFLGDTGSLFIGFILASISLEANVSKSTLASLLIPIMIVGIPIFDVLLAVVRRFSRTQLNRSLGENKKSKIFSPDLDHLHHRLLKYGFSQRKVALTMYAVAGIASISVLVSIFIDDFSLAVLLIGLLILLNIIFRKVIHLEIWTLTQWILRAVKRPMGVKRVFVHLTYDLFILIILGLIINQWFGFNDYSNSPLIIIGGVLFPILILQTFGNYKVIWSRARPWQFWKLNVELILGELLYFIFLVTVVGIFRSDINLSADVVIQLHVTRLALMSGFIVIARLTPIIMRDSSSWLRRYQTDDSHFKTLIIGSGYELAAYLRRAAYRNSHIIQRKIIGILENEILDRGTLVFGYPVLGADKDLIEIINDYNITEIIICDENFITNHRDKISECKKNGIVVKQYISDVKEV